jgi:hypothetical protein
VELVSLVDVIVDVLVALVLLPVLVLLRVVEDLVLLLD